MCFPDHRWWQESQFDHLIRWFRERGRHPLTTGGVRFSGIVQQALRPELWLALALALALGACVWHMTTHTEPAPLGRPGPTTSGILEQ